MHLQQLGLAQPLRPGEIDPRTGQRVPREPVPWFMWALLIGALVMIPTTLVGRRR